LLVGQIDLIDFERRAARQRRNMRDDGVRANANFASRLSVIGAFKRLGEK
jgi:hypothetical protein